LLEGKVAFVTGSTRGMGWATARLFARHGAKVVLNGHRDRALLDARVAELNAAHGDGTASGCFFDVADAKAVAEGYQAIFRRHGRLDVLVNNAGMLDDALIGMIREPSIERTFAVNTWGVLHNLQAAARLMQRGGGGSIVNVASIMGQRGCEGQAVYAASKAALLGMTLSAAKELAPKGVRVNAVAPGYIQTDFIKDVPPAIHAERVASLKMGRVGAPEDVAKVHLFLASDLAGYVTGQVIGVDGGMVI
jgi:3-oxoacyl-[acyl-carrier protein] reductase